MTDQNKAEGADPGPLLLDLTPPPAPPSLMAEQAAEAGEPPPLVMDLAQVEASAVATVTEPAAADVGGDKATDAAVTLSPPAFVAPKWPLRLFIGGTAAAVLTGVGFDAADLLARAFAVSSGLGWGVAAALGGAATGLVAILWREWGGLKRLRRFEELRTDAAAGAVMRTVPLAAALYADRAEMAEPLARFRLHLPDAHDDSQVLQLFEQEVLAPLDAAAYRQVSDAARDTALATALVPVALLDMLIVLWRNLKLVRAVALLYGVRPGYWASLSLMRRLLGNLAVAGVGEGVQHAAVDMLGGSLAASVSTSLGKGVVNGLLTARIGLAAMHFCRPLAFSPQRRPSLSGVRGLLLGLPKTLL
jgi:putative membrane protein